MEQAARKEAIAAKEDAELRAETAEEVLVKFPLLDVHALGPSGFKAKD